MAEGSSTQSNQNSGSGGGAFRDVNASVGALDINPSLGNAQSGSTSGDIVLGDVNSGQSNSARVGLVKSGLIVWAVLLGWYIWKKV